MLHSKQIKLSSFFYFFLGLTTLTPLFAYVALNDFGKIIYFYYKLIWVFWGIYFVIAYKPKWQDFHYFLLLFFIYLFVWSFFNGHFQEKGLYTFENSTSLALLFASLILTNVSYSVKFIKYLTVIFKITIIISFIASVIQVINPYFLNAGNLWNVSSKYITEDIYTDRRTSIFGFIDQNSLGLDYIPVFIILISHLFYKNKNINVLIFYYILAGITALLSNTRYIIVSFLIALSLIFIYRRVSFLKSFRTVVVILTLFIVLLYSLSYLGYDFRSWYSERLFSEGSIEETTRFQAISNFLIMFPEKPLIGIGSETNDEMLRLSHQVKSARIHVGYLGYLVSWGVFGSFFLFGSWFLIARMFYRNAKLTGYWGAFFGFLIFIWANFTFPKWHFFYYGLLFTFVFDKYYMDKYLNRLNKNNVN